MTPEILDAFAFLVTGIAVCSFIIGMFVYAAWLFEDDKKEKEKPWLKP